MCMCVCECAPVPTRDLELIVHARARRYRSIFLQVTRQFAVQMLPWNAQDLVNGTSRTKYFEDIAVGATIHPYRGDNLTDLFKAVNQYPPLNLRSVCIVAGFNDHHYCSHFIKCYRILLDIIYYKFITGKYTS